MYFPGANSRPLKQSNIALALYACAVAGGAFLAFVQDYAARNSGRQATSEDFFAILAEHTTADLRPLIRAYFDAME